MSSEDITILSAFFGGLISFLSPCVLPMLPTYAALLAGTGATESNKANFLFVLNSVLFLSGFVLVFVAMGATASMLGRFFFEYQLFIKKAGALLMIVMGLSLTGLIKFAYLQHEHRPLLNNRFHGPFGSFLLGIGFTAGWPPCTGPVLTAILIQASAMPTISQGTFLLLVFALGFAVPFFVVALVVRHFWPYLRGIYGILPYIQKIAGFILIIIGVLNFFDLIQKGLGILWNIF